MIVLRTLQSAFNLFGIGFALYTALQAPLAMGAPSVAGQIDLVYGDVEIIDVEGQSRVPHVNESLWEGETISTGKDGEIHVHMQDEGYIALRPNTTLKVDVYITDAANDNSVVLSLIQGTFRSITGWVGRNNPDNYRINAGPTATIGIRGTDHEPAYIPELDAGETPGGTPGVYDKVNTGKTFIQSPGGTIELGPHQIGFASHDPNIAPRLLNKLPEFYRRTKNEYRIEQRVKELNRQIEKKHSERPKNMQ